MKRCHECKADRLESVIVPKSRTVAGRSFETMMPALRCVECGAQTVHGRDLGIFEEAIAKELALVGECSSEAFSFMWRATDCGEAKELAELLGVTPETFSRWSNGKQPLDRTAFVLLSELVLDKLEGRTTTADRLRTAARRPEPRATPAPPVRLALRYA